MDESKEITEEQYRLLYEALFVAENEVRTNKNEKEYWQGRKDGMRVFLSIVQPNEKIWEQLNQSSHGFQDTERDRLLSLLEDIYYNICDILYSINHNEKIHRQTMINTLQWIDWYDTCAKQGLTKEITNAMNPIKGGIWDTKRK